MTEQEIRQFRQEKDHFFRSSPQSPLMPADREKFTGLSYYPYNPALSLVVEVEEFQDKDDLQMQTSTGDLRMYQRWGRFRFEVEGQPAELTLYFSPDNGYFFLPFMDATSGSETYPSGRYLDPIALGEQQFEIDFNLAYSPYCAYNPNYSCPIPPAENRLKVPIMAGEKNFG